MQTADYFQANSQKRASDEDERRISARFNKWEVNAKSVNDVIDIFTSELLDVISYYFYEWIIF